jgi:hypothetical protein
MGEVNNIYKRGKIYTIRCLTDNNLIYVGSTINMLAKRFDKHKRDCKIGKKYSLYNYINDDDWSAWYIELYESFECNNRMELERREGEVIREIGTINKNIAGRTHKEYYDEWYKKNTEREKARTKKYREEHIDKVKKNYKEYYENNVEKMKEKSKKYRENNTDKIKEREKEKVYCEICGSFVNKKGLTRHKKTKKCLKIDIKD